MMKNSIAMALVAALGLAQPAVSQTNAEASSCDQLVALFIELAERSGETVTEAEARAEVMSENPNDAECRAMLALFEARQ